MMTNQLASGRVIHCPAGDVARLGNGVFCKIEKNILMETKAGSDAVDYIDPSSVRKFCTGDPSQGEGFPTCPTWQLARDLDRTQQEASDGVQRAHDHQIDQDEEVLEATTGEL